MKYPTGPNTWLKIVSSPFFLVSKKPTASQKTMKIFVSDSWLINWKKKAKAILHLTSKSRTRKFKCLMKANHFHAVQPKLRSRWSQKSRQILLSVKSAKVKTSRLWKICNWRKQTVQPFSQELHRVHVHLSHWAQEFSAFTVQHHWYVFQSEVVGTCVWGMLNYLQTVRNEVWEILELCFTIHTMIFDTLTICIKAL